MGSPDLDDQLIARVCAGRLESFEALVDRHLRHIRVFTAYLAPSPESVDGITRSTFAFALENIRHFQPGTDFRGWLRAIAVRIVGVEFERVRGAALSGFEKRRLEIAERKQVDPYGVAKIDFLEASLTGLPEPLQKLYLLRYVDHKTTEQIAIALGRTGPAVRLLLFRLRQEMRRRIRAKAKEATHAK